MEEGRRKLEVRADSALEGTKYRLRTKGLFTATRRCVQAFGTLGKQRYPCLLDMEDALVYRGKKRRKVAHTIFEMTQHLLL